MSKNLMNINELTAELKNLGYTKTDIASHLGIREVTLYRWEKGLSKPKKPFIRDLERLIQEKTNQ